MVPSPVTIGKRICLLREQAGYSQAAVARALGISQPAVSQMEQGLREVSSTELFRLANLFGVEWSAFFGKKALTTKPMVMQLRGKKSETALGVARWVQKRLRTYDELRAKLGKQYQGDYFAFQHGAAPEYEIPKRTTSSRDIHRMALEAARERRGTLGIGVASIGNLWQLLDSDDVFVVRYFPKTEEEKSISGMFLYEQEKRRAIVIVNGTEPQERQHFTGAHEYAHFLTRSAASFALREDGTLTVTVDDAQTIDRTTGKDPYERFADLFAKEFLVPADALRLFVARVETTNQRDVSLETAVRAQVHFGVSQPCILWRLLNERFLTEKTRKAYETSNRWNELLRRLRPSHQTQQMAEFPDRYREVMLEAHKKKLISDGKFSELLGCPRSVGDEMLFRYYAKNNDDCV